MLSLGFNYKKIIGLIVIGIIFFSVFFLINPKKTKAIDPSVLNIINCTHIKNNSSNTITTQCDNTKDLQYLKPSVYKIDISSQNGKQCVKLNLKSGNSLATASDFYIQYRFSSIYYDRKFNVWYAIDHYELSRNGLLIFTGKNLISPYQDCIAEITNGGSYNYVLKAIYKKIKVDELDKCYQKNKEKECPPLDTEVSSHVPSTFDISSNPLPVNVVDTNKENCNEKQKQIEGLTDGANGYLSNLENALKSGYQVAEIDALKETNNNLDNTLKGIKSFIDSEDCAKCPELCEKAKTIYKDLVRKKQPLDEKFSEKITDWRTTVNQTIEDTFFSSSPCIKLNCTAERGMGKFPEDQICRSLCWLNDAIMGMINWAFELMKGAISTNTKEPYKPKANEAIEAIGSSDNGTGTTGTGSGTGSENTSGGGGGGTTGTETPNPNNISPTPTTTETNSTNNNLTQCKDACYVTYREDHAGCPRGDVGNSCRLDVENEYAICYVDCLGY